MWGHGSRVPMVPYPAPLAGEILITFLVVNERLVGRM
jgi:hypothetical protein